MAEIAILVDLPPTGELETSGGGASPTDAQMAEEMDARQKFLDQISPYLASLPNRPLNRRMNVSEVKLLGGSAWSQLNHYLLLMTVDVEGGDIGQELLTKLPPGSKLSAAGPFEAVKTWTRGHSEDEQ